MLPFFYIAITLLLSPPLSSSSSSFSPQLVATNISQHHIQRLATLSKHNEVALKKYQLGDVAAALHIYQTAFAPSTLTPIAMWRNYAWMLHSVDLESEAIAARSVVRSLSLFQSLVQLEGSEIPVDSPLAQRLQDTYNRSDSSYHGNVQLEFPSGTGKNTATPVTVNIKLSHVTPAAVAVSISYWSPGERGDGDMVLAGNHRQLSIPFRTVFELDFNGVLCQYPLMHGEPDPVHAAADVDPLVWHHLNVLKKSVTGFLAGDSVAVVQPVWDIHFANIPSLEQWHTTPSSVLTQVQVGSLNAMQEIVADIVRRDIPGDFVEAGVFRGGMSIFMAGLLAVLPLPAHGAGAPPRRTVWCADTFRGIPARSKAEASDIEIVNDVTLEWQANAYSASLEQVRSNFQRYGVLKDNVGFVEGAFADTLGTAPIRQVALLRIDCDTYIGTMDALKALYTRIPTGGVVVVDDFHLNGARTAVLEFRSAWNISTPIMPIPNDYVHSCNAMAPWHNVARMDMFLQDIVLQRGTQSKMNRILSPQAVYWRVE